MWKRGDLAYPCSSCIFLLFDIFSPRSCTQGTILFRSDAKEALQKAQEAAGGSELKIKDEAVQWEVLEGDVELETLKKILESQQESLNKRRGGRGLAFKLNKLTPYMTKDQLELGDLRDAESSSAVEYL